ncbi:MAG: hypothetical protein ACK4S3_07275 [Parvibaculum sp.]
MQASFLDGARSCGLGSSGSDTTYLPVRIAQAIARITLLPPEAMGLVERQVLASVVALSDKSNPAQAIYVRRSTLSSRLGISESQIRRYLCRLQESGWLKREQFISRSKGACVGMLALSERAMQLFAVDNPRRPATPAEIPADTRCANLHNALNHSPKIEKCLRRKDAGDRPFVENSKPSENSPPDAANGQARRPAPSRDPEIAKRKIPEELRWLAGVMSPFGVFKLMNLAKARKTTLQTVLSVTRDAVAGARNAYAYLAGVLAEERDWGLYARRRAAAIEQDRKRQEERDKAASERSALASLDGRAFASPETGRVFEVLGGILSVFSSIDDWRRGRSAGSRPATGEFLVAITSGRLAPLT